MPALATRMSRGRPESRKPLAKVSIDSGPIRSSKRTSPTIIPSSAGCACSGSLAGTTNVAPARARAHVVSRPRPAWPPVASALFPEMSMPLRASGAVVFLRFQLQALVPGQIANVCFLRDRRADSRFALPRRRDIAQKTYKADKQLIGKYLGMFG